MGQDDIKNIANSKKDAIDSIKNAYPNKLLGLSTHNLDEIKEANSLNLDYIGLGAYRDTSTKKDVNVKGKELLKIAKESKHKVALIGGVKLSDEFSREQNIYYKVVGSNLLAKYKSNFKRA